MLEIELFYKIVESHIRREHNAYLRKQKCLPEGLTPNDDETKVEATVKRTAKVKRYNKGVDMALRVLTSEYKRFMKCFKEE